MSSRSRIVTCAVFAALAGSSNAQTLYKCTLPDGRTEYQDSKCDDKARTKEIPAGPAARMDGEAACPTQLKPTYETDPVTGLETKESRRRRLGLEFAIEVFAWYDECLKTTPEFSRQFSASYRKWRENNSVDIANFQKNPVARRMSECKRAGIARIPKRTDTLIDEKTEWCMQRVGPVLDIINTKGFAE